MSVTHADITVRPARRVRGRLRVPGDKSIAHRYALLGALADGVTRIAGFAPGADCAATLDCLRALGVEIVRLKPDATTSQTGDVAIEIIGRGPRGLSAPAGPLDARNSGTTMRLLAGILAGHPFSATIDGDASLRRRPMRRVMVPLERMGAKIDARDGRPPLTVHGTALAGIEFTPEVPSAQVKSAVLLAGLHASGSTVVNEPAPTRDHTERALRAFGVAVECGGEGVRIVRIDGGGRLTARDVTVPGDLSSAAFWAAAAAARPGSDLEIIGVGLNPTRTAWIDALRRMGADIDTTFDQEEAGEPVGSVRVRGHGLRSMEIVPGEVPLLIDELPVLAAVATHGGELRVTGAGELRAKESDRIAALAAGLRAMGADIEELPDGFHVRGTRPLSGGVADACGDHRLAMSFAIAALGATAPCIVRGAEAVDVSYPGFFDVLQTVVERDGR